MVRGRDLAHTPVVPRISAANLQEHHQLTWQRLLDALETLLTERDFGAITLADVAGRAGIARNTIYNYVPDKAALLGKAAERAGRTVSARVAEIAERQASAADRLGAIVDVLVTSFAHGAVRVVLQDASARADPGTPTESASPYHLLIGYVRHVVRAGIEGGEFRAVADLDLTVSLLAGLVSSGVERALTVDDADRAPIADTVTDLLLRCLRPDPERT